MDRELDSDKNRTGVALGVLRAELVDSLILKGKEYALTLCFPFVCVTWLRSPVRENLIVLTRIKCVPETIRRGQDLG